MKRAIVRFLSARYEGFNLLSGGAAYSSSVTGLIQSAVRMKGFFLKEARKVGLVNSETGAKQLELLEDEQQFDTTEIEEKVSKGPTHWSLLGDHAFS